MAALKIITIKADLSACIAYAVNAEKTTEFEHLASSLGYIADNNKTAESRYVSAVNCTVENAFADMTATKKRFRKLKTKRQAYHVIQSFEPGEVEPALAHQIARELVIEVFPGYEAVIATHIDKLHVHNHIVFNSVNAETGAMFDNRNGFLDYELRAASNRLCRKYGLSVILKGKNGEKSKIEFSESSTGERVTKDAKGFSRSRSEWNANQKGRATVYSEVRSDLNRIISRSRNWEDFTANLQKAGYGIRHSQGELKHFAILTPSGRKIRLDALGDGFSEGEIRARINRQVELAANGNPFTARAIRNGKIPLPQKKAAVTHSAARVRGMYRPKQKLRGFKALYFRYLYLLGKIPQRRANPVRSEVRASRYLQAEVRNLDRILAQERFLRTWKLETSAELTMFDDAVSNEIYILERERKQLYALRRRTPGADDEQLFKLNAQLKERRGQLRMCRRIEVDSREIEKRLEQAGAFAEQPIERKSSDHQRQTPRKPTCQLVT